MDTFVLNLMQRMRRRRTGAAAGLYGTTCIDQPVPLVKLVAQPQATSGDRDSNSNKGSSGSSSSNKSATSGTSSSRSVRYVSTGITGEAEALLAGLAAPVYVVAFAGFGRSGKSHTASCLRERIAGNIDHKFRSAAGNVPVTHGIDMAVFKNPKGPGHILFLDCEGGANHNQTAMPFVIGLASRLACRTYIFERGCFTTSGLETIVQMVNMGHATSTDAVSVTKSVVLVENMSINQEIPNATLLDDLLSEEDGDESTNRMRRIIKNRFQIEFTKLPFDPSCSSSSAANASSTSLDRPSFDSDTSTQHILHSQICDSMAESLLDNLLPFELGGVPVDGMMIVHLVNELVAQIRRGGDKFNMVSATEALVSNMATEAANTVWTEFIDKVRKMGNHPSQIKGRKNLRTVMREVEAAANSSMNELDVFLSRLVPPESAQIGRQIWDRNYLSFQSDIRTVHARKVDEIARFSSWYTRVNIFIREVFKQLIEVAKHLAKFTRFSTTLLLTTNYSLWKHGMNMLTNFSSNFSISSGLKVITA